LIATHLKLPGLTMSTALRCGKYGPQTFQEPVISWYDLAVGDRDGLGPNPPVEVFSRERRRTSVDRR
jgi:hypothetical protein